MVKFHTHLASDEPQLEHRRPPRRSVKTHQHRVGADFRVSGNQNFTVSTVFDPIPGIGGLNVQNRTHGKLIERYAALHLRLAYGAIDGVVKIRSVALRLPSFNAG